MAFAAACAALAALGACGPKQKIQECQALVGAINEGVHKVQKTMGATPNAGETVSDLRAFATEMDNVAKTTEKVGLTTPELQKLSTRYQELTREVAATARELGDAVDAADVEKVNKLQSRMDEAVKKEDPLVEELNKFCQTP